MTCMMCYNVFAETKKNKCQHYSISNRKSYTVYQVAKLFSNKIKFLNKRKGERYASALTDMNLSNQVHKRFGKTDLKKYIKSYKLSISKKM